MSESDRRVPTRKAASDAKDTKLRVLVVDDNSGDRELIKRHLLRYDAMTFEVSLAATAQEALQAIKQDQPDLVLLDHRLPVEDGLSVLRRIDRRNRPPIVMLTGSDDERIVAEAMSLGARDFLRKSVINAPGFAQLVHEVAQRLGVLDR